MQMRDFPSTVALSGCRIDRALGSCVEIVEASRGNRHFPVRVNESLGVCLKIGPAHHVTVNGRDVIYPADAICVRSPGCVWSTDSTGPAAFLSLDLDPSLLPSGLFRGGMLFASRQVLPGFPALARMLRTRPPPEQLMELVTNLVLVLGRSKLIDWGELRQSVPVRISRRVRNTLENSVAAPPALSDLAADSRISRFVLLRQFKSDFGITPHAFSLRLRVERARERLARGGDLREIAVDLGFADQPHFTRVFTRIVGVPPGAYARRVRRVVSVS